MKDRIVKKKTKFAVMRLPVSVSYDVMIDWHGYICFNFSKWNSFNSIKVIFKIQICSLSCFTWMMIMCVSVVRESLGGGNGRFPTKKPPFRVAF